MFNNKFTKKDPVVEEINKIISEEPKQIEEISGDLAVLCINSLSKDQRCFFCYIVLVSQKNRSFTQMELSFIIFSDHKL